jgi:hypothetical protein
VRRTDLSFPDIFSHKDPLDLLGRFAPTPLKVHVHLEAANVLLETNDLSLVSTLSAVETPVSCPSTQPCLWRIVRDVELRGKAAEVSIVMAAGLIVFSMGPACLIGADRGRREILAFIGLEMDARTFEKSVFPALCRLTEFVMREDEPAELDRDPQVARGDQCNA